MMRAVWLGSSQAELVRSWCVLRCGGEGRRRKARARLGMCRNDACSLVGVEPSGAGVCCGAAAKAAAAKLERG